MGPDLEPQENFRLVRQVADHAPERRRQLLDEGRCGENLFVFRPLWVLEHVDDLELVLSLQLFRADSLEVRDRYLGTGTCPGHIERQQVFIGQESSSMAATGISVFQRSLFCFR